jgi:hypothetical protein
MAGKNSLTQPMAQLADDVLFGGRVLYRELDDIFGHVSGRLPREAKRRDYCSRACTADLDSIYDDGSKNVRSEPTTDLDGIQTAWESVPDLKARGPVDFRKFVEPRFIEEVLREMK